MMVIIPVDADENIAQHVAEKSRNHWTQARQRGFVRDAQIEHHDRDEDGDHAIAESFEPSFAHILVFKRDVYVRRTRRIIPRRAKFAHLSVHLALASVADAGGLATYACRKRAGEREWRGKHAQCFR